ncbi:hypothetical protein C4H11_04060 [Bacteroides zoogleoformans]|uniref:Uncharacterized protein n=1 Tax=Bacteroides zoogleoformans TaxID=28119 RepID=A0ABM6T608_9BACE|nr:hypothetical protein C4H11_04060 [Bacteroides zoogleoformans]
MRSLLTQEKKSGQSAFLFSYKGATITTKPPKSCAGCAAGKRRTHRILLLITEKKHDYTKLQNCLLLIFAKKNRRFAEILQIDGFYIQILEDNFLWL